MKGLYVKLYDRTGKVAATVPMPDSPFPPRVIVHKDVYYCLFQDGEYRETTPFVAGATAK